MLRELKMNLAYDIIKNEDGMTLDVSNAKTRINIVVDRGKRHDISELE